MIEVALIYRPGPPRSDVECRIATSHDAESVRTVALAALHEARRAVDDWQSLNPQIAAIRQAEVDRLDAVLRQVVPGYAEASKKIAE